MTPAINSRAGARRPSCASPPCATLQCATLQTRRRAARRRATSSGFTLVEMLIAMVSGLLIAAAAFLLARNASSFFQAEAGITHAQFSSMLGFTRLQEDLRRAGLMSSPNIASDPLRCGTTAGWPAGMIETAAIRIEEGGSVTRHTTDHVLSAINGLNPDALIIGGMFGSTEHFAIQAMVSDGGGGYRIVLQNDGAMTRTQLAATSGSTPLDGMFRSGRMLRIVDAEGRTAYGRIYALDASGSNVNVFVANTPAVPTKETQGTCGCQSWCKGGLVNPVARVLYDIRSVNAPQYVGLYTNATNPLTAFHQGGATAPRTELVRVELDADGVEITQTLEILAEFAVDLKFGLSTATPPIPPATLPTMARHAIGDPDVYIAAAALSGGGTPQRIRSVQVRMSVRAPKRDRDVDVPIPNPNGIDVGILRYNLGTDGGSNPLGFARVRTMVADVALPNLNGANW